ncbi:reverse transcriptase [Gossypium australe]|uniref:Reverse transcriptase n=1 Tax=Gossypium australe TaxID=47621 RepID=A0A5B6WL42_9ROSI|nr:reverse transcriptase [Gossypium australe]
MNYYLNRFHVVLRKPHVLEANAKQVAEKLKRIWRMKMVALEDIMTKIVDVHNLYNFIDPDILLRLEELDREEGLRQVEEEGDDFEMDALAEIRKKKSLLIQQHRLKKSTGESRPFIPRKFDTDRKFTTERMSNQLSCLGLDPPLAINRASSKSRGQKRER